MSHFAYFKSIYKHIWFDLHTSHWWSCVLCTFAQNWHFANTFMKDRPHHLSPHHTWWVVWVGSHLSWSDAACLLSSSTLDIKRKRFFHSFYSYRILYHFLIFFWFQCFIDCHIIFDRSFLNWSQRESFLFCQFDCVIKVFLSLSRYFDSWIMSDDESIKSKSMTYESI